MNLSGHLCARISSAEVHSSVPVWDNEHQPIHSTRLASAGTQISDTMATETGPTASRGTAPAPFSYAQAAKGLSSAPASSTTSKPSSGSATSAKHLQLPTVPSAGALSWADDAEANDAPFEITSSSHELRTQSQVAPPKPATASQVTSLPIVSSPVLASSSASTVTKDDDVSSLPNSSSESTWENKSQASTSVERSVESAEKSSEKPAEKENSKSAEGSPAKPLQQAPIPMVNVWKQRAENAKAKTKAAPVKPAGLPDSAPQSHVPAARQSKPVPTAESHVSKDNVSNGENKAKGKEEQKGTQVRKDSRAETDSDKAKKGSRSRPQEKHVKSVSTAFSLPSDRDQEAWPTPETALDENRKKTSERIEKERKEMAAGKPAGKKEWVNLAITPNVIFNTPLPSSAGSRRGGRGAGRGGAQSSGRAAGFNASGPGPADKDGSASTAPPNGEQPRRGRPDGFNRETSPKVKRTNSVSSLPPKNKASAFHGQHTSRIVAPEAEVPSQRASVPTDPDAQVPGQFSAFPRPYQRPIKGRRGEFTGQDKRKDSDSTSPTKENGSFHDRRMFTAPRTDCKQLIGSSYHVQHSRFSVSDDSERRGANLVDGQASHVSKRGSADRQYNSFSGRDKTRGGARGGRGNYSNGHPYTNGHLSPLKSSSTFQGPISPTSFNPDQSAYFAPPPSRFRNGPRSQSVTPESTYRLPGQYGDPQQISPVQAYMGGMYDYPLMQPMSAGPFAQSGMDPYTLFSMVTTQLYEHDSLAHELVTNVGQGVLLLRR